MMQSNQDQLHHLFACLGFGVWLSFWYDLFRVYRLWHRCSKTAAFFQDILFFISGMVWFFLFLLAVNGGELRPDILAAAVLGFILCRQTAGRFTIVAARAIKRLSTRLHRIFAPLGTAIENFAANFCKKIAIFSKKGLRRLSLLLYNKIRK